jgi:hypothetical protein
LPFSFALSANSLFNGICNIFQPITRDSEVSLLESVLLSDTQLWKAARSAWHRLFIAGLLMDPDAKRDFATVTFVILKIAINLVLNNF